MLDGPLNLIEIPKDGLIIHINDRHNYNLENISKKELYNCNFDENYEYLTLLINKQLPPDNSYSFYYPTDFDESITFENIENKLTTKEIAHAITSAIEMDDRGFINELNVWATNPFN